MSEGSTAESTLVPVRHNIGNPTLNPGEASSLPYVNNSGLPKAKSTPRNQSFSKLKRKGTHRSQENLDRKPGNLEGGYGNGDLFKFPVLELTLNQSAEDSNSRSIKPDKGRKYLENYKAVLKQRGVKYQEVFGHTPRKPDQRVARGDSTTKAPVLVMPLAKSSIMTSHRTSQHRQHQNTPESPMLFPHTKLPGIVTEGDLAMNANSRYSFTRSDAINLAGKPLSEREFSNNNGDVLSHGNVTDDEDLMTDRFSEVLNGYTGAGFTPRRVRKRGKLGEVMTQKKMDELLETGEPLRMENYYNMYD